MRTLPFLSAVESRTIADESSRMWIRLEMAAQGEAMMEA